MPELHTMVVWYADKDCAAAFIYHKGGDGGCITWRGSWDVELDHDVVAAWSRVAERNGGRPLRVFKELLKKNEFMCHGDAIYLLSLPCEVVAPQSLWQIRIEHRRQSGTRSGWPRVHP